MGKSKGFSLIEVLVAFVIASVGLLGLATVQILSLKNINNTQYRSLATVYAYDMVERMRSNKSAVDAGAYDSITGGENPPNCTACTAAQIAQQDAYMWNAKIKQNIASGGLVGGVGTVTKTGEIFNIVVSWQEQTRDGAGGAVVNESFTLSIRI